MCGSNSLLLTEEPCICDFSLQLMSCCARDVGSASTVSLPPLLQLFFLYILSCRNTFLLVFRLSSGRVSCVCCSFGVSMGRGELRIFLLCHLDPSSQGVKQVAQDHTVNKWQSSIVQECLYFNQQSKPLDPVLIYHQLITI